MRARAARGALSSPFLVLDGVDEPLVVGRAVIQQKTKNTDREQAMHYGRLSGYFDETNGLTRSGEYLAQFLQLDLAHERAG